VAHSPDEGISIGDDGPWLVLKLVIMGLVELYIANLK